MVYCKLIDHTNNTAKYHFGGDGYDYTGILEFDINNESFEVIKKPEKSLMIIRHIRSLYFHHRDEFKKGIFKEQIAYENG